MKKIIIFFTLFLYADISNVLFQIDKIENYKPKFKHINIKKCNEVLSSNHIKIINNHSNLKLKAIFNKKVLIDNKWLGEGNIVKGYKIIKIYPKKVLLKKENNFLILRFNNNLLKVKK